MLLTPRINSRHHITPYITHVSEFFPQRAFEKILAAFRNSLFPARSQKVVIACWLCAGVRNRNRCKSVLFNIRSLIFRATHDKMMNSRILRTFVGENSRSAEIMLNELLNKRFKFDVNVEFAHNQNIYCRKDSKKAEIYIHTKSLFLE